ncbi:MAG: hypothetical protein DME25_16795, partial [Verrucomicrobia bacterium]
MLTLHGPGLPALLLLCFAAIQIPAKDQAPRPANFKFSPLRGFYRAPFDLTITSEVGDVKIYFTTDGAAPAPDPSRICAGPIPIRTMTILRAAGFKEGTMV